MVDKKIIIASLPPPSEATPSRELLSTVEKVRMFKLLMCTARGQTSGVVTQQEQTVSVLSESAVE